MKSAGQKEGGGGVAKKKTVKRVVNSRDEKREQWGGSPRLQRVRIGRADIAEKEKAGV